MWLLLTVGGNLAVKRALIESLEQPFEAIAPLECEPFDAILVLGGSTNVTVNGFPQLSFAGDRVMLAARLFHAGKTKIVIVSGQQFARTTPKDLDPKDEAQRILVEIGIPEEKIVMLNGMNTSEEIANLKKWLGIHPEINPGRIGLVSSAWHLPRALKLAAANGLNVEPVPANFLSGPYVPEPSMIVPSGENLQWTGVMLHEYLGRWLGR